MEEYFGEQQLTIEPEHGKAQILKPPSNKPLTTAEIDDQFFHQRLHVDETLKLNVVSLWIWKNCCLKRKCDTVMVE